MSERLTPGQVKTLEVAGPIILRQEGEIISDDVL